MGVRNCAKNIQKDLDSSLHAQTALVAILINLFPLHMFKNEIGLSTSSHAGVNQFRDVRMRQLAENSAFPPESFSRCGGAYGKM